MTREEAIYRLKNTAWLGTDKDRTETEQAVDMAIESLQSDAVPIQEVKLKDGFKIDDIPQDYKPKILGNVEVVARCNDCRYWYKKMNKCNRCPSISGNWGADDFCSYGERKEP